MEQFIDKAAVVAEIESLRRTSFTNFDEGVNAAVQILLEKLDTLEVKEADAHHHWISVDDELPEENKWVLTYNGSSINLLMLAGNGGWYDHSVAKHRNVTHWMPLPAPPVVSNSGNTGKKGGER